MSNILQQDIPYHQNSAVYVNALAGKPWTLYLDSCRAYSEFGRYDIVVADPVATVVTRGDQSEFAIQGVVKQTAKDPFSLTRGLLGDSIDNQTTYPFIGGAIGYFGYDLGRRIERFPSIAENDQTLPDMMVGIYDWALIIDHDQQKTTLVSALRYPVTHAQWGDLVELFSNPVLLDKPLQIATQGPMQSNMSEEEYQAAFNAIQHYITEGDCYQVNLARRFQLQCEADAWGLYCRLREFNPAPFSAYLNFPEQQIMSCSPERFLCLNGNRVETKPIKGTAPRSQDQQLDAVLKRKLEQSRKDRAENLMIVDLLRNDLGKVCVPGSIEVTKLFDVESFPSVHHLVSTIKGTLADEEDALSLLRSAFPGGSITGAPKLRAMEIIEELEPHRRGIYCGCIGYIGYDGNMDSNIAIRTFLYKEGLLSYSAGGGIVADSTCAAEYQETYHKARVMFELFGLDSSA